MPKYCFTEGDFVFYPSRSKYLTILDETRSKGDFVENKALKKVIEAIGVHYSKKYSKQQSIEKKGRRKIIEECEKKGLIISQKEIKRLLRSYTKRHGEVILCTYNAVGILNVIINVYASIDSEKRIINAHKTEKRNKFCCFQLLLEEYYYAIIDLEDRINRGENEPGYLIEEEIRGTKKLVKELMANNDPC